MCPLLIGAAFVVSCGDGADSQDDVSPTLSSGVTPAAEPAPNSRGLAPPLEGPQRRLPTQRINYREHADFQFPNPADLPPPPDDAEGLEFSPPAASECPEGWERLVRPAQGFQICYPDDWTIDGHGYVTGGADDRWYSLGIFRFAAAADDDDAESAHVSVYEMGPYSQPFTYILTCEQAYQVTLAGKPASLCHDHPGEFPEAKIIAYHLREGDHDYFVQVVPHFARDEETGEYLATWSMEDEETAIRIAHSFQLIETTAAQPTPSRTPE